ncbi:LPXTG-motif cell wall-anchored protein [Lactobacillus colini]|uniref:LPXTG-motif cell wall-anchored protein n=1 Tax=Lactobacillus colini TaxID=1819254 RepID=A0ABS4MFQ1_9LACO|nr:YSIRK-type signal peptide-containing protein [Lactobacillus colini]MBP2058520.1 LPXTG-motif cell wall-anchored protein [Lactobacillus colini]
MRLSKNNIKERQRKTAQIGEQHFGLRKLSIGVASVLLSTSLYFGVSTNVANAATNDSEAGTQTATTTNTQSQSTADAATNQDAVSTTSSTASNTDNTSEKSAQTTQAVSTTTAENSQDSVKDSQTATTAATNKQTSTKDSTPVATTSSLATTSTDSTANSATTNISKTPTTSSNESTNVSAYKEVAINLDDLKKMSGSDLAKYVFTSLAATSTQDQPAMTKGTQSFTGKINVGRTGASAGSTNVTFNGNTAYSDNTSIEINRTNDSNNSEYTMSKADADSTSPVIIRVRTAIITTGTKNISLPEFYFDYRSSNITDNGKFYPQSEIKNAVFGPDKTVYFAQVKNENPFNKNSNFFIEQDRVSVDPSQNSQDYFYYIASWTFDNANHANETLIAIGAVPKLADDANSYVFRKGDTDLPSISDMITNEDEIVGNNNLTNKPTLSFNNFDTTTPGNRTGQVVVTYPKFTDDVDLTGYVDTTGSNFTINDQAYTSQNVTTKAVDFTYQVVNADYLQKAYDNANKILNNLNYTQADADKQTALTQQIAEAKSIIDNHKSTQDQVYTALNNLKAAVADLNGFNNLSSLNDKQKSSLEEQFKNVDLTADTLNQDVTDIANTADALNTAMSNLNTSVSDYDTTKSSVNYTNADADKQTAYDNAVAAAQAILAKDGDNADSSAVQAAQKAVEDAKAALNGKANLDKSKQAAKDAIDKLANLNDAQKQAAKDAVDNATTPDAVTTAQTTAKTLDDDMGDLNTSVSDYDTTKSSLNYTNADADKQKAYDDAVAAAQAILAKVGDNADSSAVQAAKKAVEDAKAALNGNANLEKAKQAAKDAIDALTNLNDAQKTAAKEAVEKATDPAGVTTAQNTATNLNGNMGDLNSSVGDYDTTEKSVNYTNADADKQKAYDDAVAAAKAILAKDGDNADSSVVQAAQKAVEDAKAALNGNANLEKAKQAAKDAIDKLANLNDAQKQAAKDAVDNATDPTGVDNAKNNATNLDGSMGNLKSEAEKSDDVKKDLNYTNASQAAKDAYDNALSAAEKIIAQNGSNSDDEAVQEALTNLQKAKEGLDGNANLDKSKQAAKDAIDKLANLNDAQKQAAKAAVAAAKNPTDVDSAKTTATSLDKSMGDLKSEADKSNDVKKDLNYTNASQAAKDDYDKALSAAENIINQNGPDSDDPAVQEALTNLQKAKNALDGNANLDKSKEAAKAAIDALTNLNDAQKTAAKAAVAAAKNPTDVDSAKTTATNLDKSMGDLKSEADKSSDVKKDLNYTNASQTAKDAYDKAVKNAQDVIAKQGPNAEDPAVQAAIDDLKLAEAGLNGIKNLADSKAAVKQAIDNLANLNDAQKAAAKAAVDSAATPDAVTSAQNTANTLNGTMGDLIVAEDGTSAVKTSLNYTNASQTAKDAYDKAVKNAQEVIAKQGPNAEDPAVQAAIDDLKLAEAGLNGIKNLADSKAAVKQAIDNLANLNDAQKAAAKAAVDSATTPDAVTSAQNTANTLNGTMGDLIVAEDGTSAVKTSLNYTNASQAAKDAYDKAVKNAQEVIAKQGPDAKNPAVLAAIEALKLAASKLDGNKNLDDAKAVANLAIDKLEYLNDAQKQAAKSAINSAADPTTLAQARLTANNLNAVMGSLIQLVNNVKDDFSLVKYQYATGTKQVDFDTAFKGAQAIIAKEGLNVTQEAVQKALEALKQADEALDGVEPAPVVEDTTNNVQQPTETPSTTEPASANKPEKVVKPAKKQTSVHKPVATKTIKQATPSAAKQSANKAVPTAKKLPQTGEANDQKLSLLGLGLAVVSLAGLAGLELLKRKKDR